MFHFLEIDIREQKKYEKRMQTSVDDTMSNLHCEIKFENHVKDKNTTFLLSETFNKYIFFLETFFFFLMADTKKHRNASARAKCLKCCTGKTY